MIVSSIVDQLWKDTKAKEEDKIVLKEPMDSYLKYRSGDIKRKRSTEKDRSEMNIKINDFRSFHIEMPEKTPLQVKIKESVKRKTKNKEDSKLNMILKKSEKKFKKIISNSRSPNVNKNKSEKNYFMSNHKRKKTILVRKSPSSKKKFDDMEFGLNKLMQRTYHNLVQYNRKGTENKSNNTENPKFNSNERDKKSSIASRLNSEKSLISPGDHKNLRILLRTHAEEERIKNNII